MMRLIGGGRPWTGLVTLAGVALAAGVQAQSACNALYGCDIPEERECRARGGSWEGYGRCVMPRQRPPGGEVRPVPRPDGGYGTAPQPAPPRPAPGIDPRIFDLFRPTIPFNPPSTGVNPNLREQPRPQPQLSPEMAEEIRRGAESRQEAEAEDRRASSGASRAAEDMSSILRQAAQRASALPVMGPCDPGFNHGIETMIGSFRSCAASSDSMRSMIDMLNGASTRALDVGVLRATSDPDMYNLIGPNDPRWRKGNGVAMPNCAVPLQVRNQQEAFLECTRSFICGAQAAVCARELARASRNMTCEAASQQCLAQYPVPQMAPEPARR